MSIHIRVNGSEIDHIEVVNKGAVGGDDGASYDPDDFDGGGGVRRYEWRVATGQFVRRRGFVLHRRSEGARTLAASVLEAAQRAEQQ